MKHSPFNSVAFVFVVVIFFYNNFCIFAKYFKIMFYIEIMIFLQFHYN